MILGHRIAYLKEELRKSLALNKMGAAEETVIVMKLL
jgi:hypothetical protein